MGAGALAAIFSRVMAPANVGQALSCETAGQVFDFSNIAAKASADGYTLLFGGASLWILPFLQDVPVVMYSTANLEKESLKAGSNGATAFMTKPSNFTELKNKLSELFRELFPGSGTA